MAAEIDAELLSRVARGDRAAFACLVRRHSAPVLRFARSLVDAGSAEDVLQETFLAAYRKADTFRGAESARAWLLAIARNAARRLHRRPSPVLADEEALAELGARAGWGQTPSPLAAAEGAELRERLAAALERLAPADREAIVLRDLEGLTTAETAQVLGIRPGAVKTRLHRARLRLMGALRAGGRGQ